MFPHVQVIYGPTASGKSAAAMRIAQMRPCVIINADAMQCYAGLRILTARPSIADEAAVPHALYGMWESHVHGNAALWVQAAVQAIRAAWAQQKLPLLVGGTGLYIRALMEGLSAIPPIPPAIREELHGLSHAERLERLRRQDAVMAARLKPGDTQRVFRALEVLLATGKSLSLWQQEKAALPLPEAQFEMQVIAPNREVLYANINARFDAMMRAGALEEVRDFLAHHPNVGTPIFKAHGLPELAAHLRGDMTLEEAATIAKQHTRNYAKRQLTWARQQLGFALGTV